MNYKMLRGLGKKVIDACKASGVSKDELAELLSRPLADRKYVIDRLSQKTSECMRELFIRCKLGKGKVV